MPRDDHHRNIRVVAFDRFQNINTVHPAVFQPDIKDHQTGRFGIDLGHAIVGICRQPNAEPFIFQDIPDQFADVFFVVNDQNTAHIYPPWPMAVAVRPGRLRDVRGRRITAIAPI